MCTHGWINGGWNSNGMRTSAVAGSQHGLDLLEGHRPFRWSSSLRLRTARGGEQRFVSVGLVSGQFVALVWTDDEDPVDFAAESQKCAREGVSCAIRLKRSLPRSPPGRLTDLERVKAMSQEEVERLADEEDGPLPDGLESTIIIVPPRRRCAHPARCRCGRLVPRAGPGYQTRINAVLRTFVVGAEAGG